MSLAHLPQAQDSGIASFKMLSRPRGSTKASLISFPCFYWFLFDQKFVCVVLVICYMYLFVMPFTSCSSIYNGA